MAVCGTMTAAAAAGTTTANLARLYGRLCSATVTVSDAWFLSDNVVQINRSINDIDEDRKRVMQYTAHLAHGLVPAFPTELPATVIAALPSPSGRKMARIVKLTAKPKVRVCIELWHGGSLCRRIDCSKLHDDVITSGSFGALNWSEDESRIVYVAEEKIPESPSPFGACADGASSDKAEEVAAGRANWYREDWGEKLGGSDHLALFMAKFSDGSISKVFGVPEDITPGQPVFWGEEIVYVGWPAGVRKLGLLFCVQRPCALYATPWQTASNGSGASAAQPHSCLSAGLHVARCPRPAPGGGALAFLVSLKPFDTHGGCLELFLLENPKVSPRCLVEVQAAPSESGFAGLYNGPLDPCVPRDCWHGGRIYFNVPSGAREEVWSVSTGGSSTLERLNPPSMVLAQASTRLLATGHAGLLLMCSDPCRPGKLVIRKDDGGDCELPAFDPCAVVAGVPCGLDFLEGVKFDIMKVKPSDGGEVFDAVLVEPVEEEQQPGLILFIHGGPHAVSTTWFNHSVAVLIRATGCAVLQVNYRGSIGFGRTALESITGRIGTQDVSDCMAALSMALETGRFDTERVAVTGGSHGGFLTTHLIGQHPATFKAAAVRNPVINIPAMITATDIPDWGFVETLGTGKYNFASATTLPTAKDLQAMLAASPIAHVDKVVTPTLVALGLKDQRVPPSQGKEFYYALAARGVPTRLLCYEKDTHALDSAATDADFWINVGLWFSEFMPKHLTTAPPPPEEGVLRTASLGV